MTDLLAERAGIEDSYVTAFGETRTITAETRRAILDALGQETAPRERASAAAVHVRIEGEPLDLPAATTVLEERGQVHDTAALVPGYYTLRGKNVTGTLIVAPRTAYVPPELDAEPRFGLAVQLYSLRSAYNWGIGDFGDLQRLAATMREGVAALALNPLHQSHLSNPASASPYAPLSRYLLNALYVDVQDAAQRFGATVDDRDAAALRDAALIDYPRVARAKLRALESVHAAFRALPERDTRRHAYDAFVGSTPRVSEGARYEALMEYFRARDSNVYGWMQWPQPYRDARSAAVEAFAAEHAARVDFYAFLQWIADLQLASAAQAAAAMPIGIYRDLAVGVDRNSVDVWSDPAAYALDLSVGAPPDPLGPQGQDWGLPPFHPAVLRERAYAPFIELVRANMRHAGALRIDHVMGLRRLFCIPRGLPASEGAYVRQDFDALLGILKLESHRNRCMLVGEDLGTVPPGFRERMGDERVFGCRVFFFERASDGSFSKPDTYTADAVASAGTHDLPTLAGLWTENDIAVRMRLGLYDEDAAARERWFRGELRTGVLRALEEERVISPATARALEQAGASPSAELLALLVTSVYTWLGRTRSKLVLMQLEDIVLQREQMNVPGTIDEEPNWRRRVAIPVDHLPEDERFRAIARAMREARASNEARA